MSLMICGRTYADGEVRVCAVRIENGRIAAILDADDGSAEARIDLGEREILLPSAIDLQCALRDWGEAERETVDTCTRAALAGGVTAVGDQSNTVPRIDSLELVRKRAGDVAARAWCDFGIAGHPPANPAELDRYREAGAFSVQFWPWDQRPWRYPRDTDDSRRYFGRCAELGLTGLIVVDELAFQGTALEEEGERYALEALLRRLDPAFRARVSVTRPDSVETLLAHRERLPNMRIQVPHHSLFADREWAYGKIGSAAFHVPPLRPAEEVRRMQALAARGSIDIVVSFHAPHRLPDKYGSEPIPGEFTPKAGYSAVEVAYMYTLTKLGIETGCRCHCAGPAEHLGLDAGEIRVGNEANLVIVEEDEGLPEQNIHVTGSAGRGVWKVDPSGWHTMAKVTPFVGERLKYRVSRTLLRGREVFDRSRDRFTHADVRALQATDTALQG